MEGEGYVVRLLGDEVAREGRDAIRMGAVAGGEVSDLGMVKGWDWEGELPILEMDDTLDAYLRNVVVVEEDICKDCETQQDAGCDREQQSVEICLARGFGRCDTDGLENEVLQNVSLVIWP